MSTAIAKTEERKAAIMLGDEQVAVRIDEQGFMTRVMRKVRLHYGTDLYAAAKSPSADDKVMPYQPGYMKLVAAMSGQLVCPPVMRDPVTGERRANPIVEFYEGTGLIRSVTATAVCVAPNPTTGEFHASVQSITIDAEHILRQALLKVAEDRTDAVRVLSKDDVDAERAEGKLKEWGVFPLAPPYGYLCANFANPAVRQALVTFQHQSGTIRQRACSKAERLAADHNPITRKSWRFGDLVRNNNGAPYVEVPVVAWVTHRGLDEMREMLATLATEGQHESVASVVFADNSDDDTETPDDTDTEPGEGGHERREIEEKPTLVHQREQEREKVQAEPAPTAAAEKPARQDPPRQQQAAAAPPAADEALRIQIAEFEAELSDADVKDCRSRAGVPIDGPIPTGTPDATLREYRKALNNRLDTRN